MNSPRNPARGRKSRSPRSFADPDKFDIAREQKSHVALGEGIHFCIGAPLARLDGSNRDRRDAVPVSELRLSEPDPKLTYKGSFAQGRGQEFRTDGFISGPFVT